MGSVKGGGRRVDPHAAAPDARSEDNLDPLRVLARALEHARHLLPTQGPIHVFVHHNTLHAFQERTFEEAVAEAAHLFGTEPYESEEAFGRHLASGRITAADVAAVLAEEDLSDLPIFPGGPSVRELRALRLSCAIERVDGPALAWLLEEGGALSRFHPSVSASARERVLASAARAAGRVASEPEALAALYACLAPHAPSLSAPRIGPRPRDRLLASHGVDVDTWIHPLLIKTCAAFLDQGVAYWSMPGRERGFLRAFRALYGQRVPPPDPWLAGLPRLLAEAERAQEDAEQTILKALRALDVPPDRWPEVITATLRALPGWAGMIANFEVRPESAPVHAPPARLADDLAVALTLEAHAVRYVLRTYPKVSDAEAARKRAAVDGAVVYETFVLAQLAGLGPAALIEPRHARALVAEVVAFGSVERRRCWHLAYELHHRQHVLDALFAHARLGNARVAAPSAQVIFCIDEREESLRRHLEEVAPTVETLGCAGFFNVAMAYQGWRTSGPAPLPRRHPAAAPRGRGASRERSGRRERGPKEGAGASVACMANDLRVRATLRAHGIEIPAETWFVGAQHNPCSDSIDYFDLDLFPPARQAAFERLRAALEEARRLHAHERCRRFESVPLWIDPERALAHVEGRAVDLGEPRPEYGHATNSICFVGRRERTRGLFMDRRAFLVSYDPSTDPSGEILGGLLAAVGPVCAGINLEYYFSFVDPAGYGCGTKLPHNIVGLIGIMDGQASDLRTGLPCRGSDAHGGHMTFPLVLLFAVACFAAPALAFAVLALSAWSGLPGSERTAVRTLVLACSLGFAAAVALGIQIHGTGTTATIVTIGQWFEVDHHCSSISLAVDGLALTFSALASALLGLIAAWSARSMHRERGFVRFYLLLALFGTGVQIVVWAGTLDILFFGWELVGIASTLLIAFFNERAAPV